MRPTQPALFRFTAALALVAALALTACSGGNGSSFRGSTDSTTSAASGGTTLNVTMGDDPGNSVVSFSVSVDSIALTNTSSTTVSVLSTPTQLELTHLAGTSTPIATVSIPPGN